MKRLKLCLIALIICFGLYGCKGIDFTSTRRYADCMNLNWHLSLPETDVVIYEKNSGASFTGDGTRYHILQYDEENAAIINEAKKSGGRIISVGTTSTRRD